MKFDVMNPACPSRTVLRHVTDKWTPLIVTALSGNVLRFGELKTSVGPITAKVLTETLRSMERDGLITRNVIPTNPPGVEYELTKLGDGLSAPIEALREWAERNANLVLKARDLYDSQHG